MIIDISTKIGTTSNQGGFKGLLDVYSGAAAAYSLRKLSKATTSVVRVRRDSDNAEADFTALEITDGTLEAWVNTDVVKYTSDFTSGNEDLVETNGIGTDGETIAGVSDAYKFTLSGGNNLHYFRTNTSINTNYTYKVEFDYYIPSGQNVNGIKLTGFNPQQSATTIDSWDSISFEDNPLFAVINIFATINGNVTIDSDGDVVYIKNLRITQTTSDGLVTTWYDQSGNGNDATQGSAAAQPKIVDAGVLVTENGKAAVSFDGVVGNFLDTTYQISTPVSTFVTINETKLNDFPYIVGNTSGAGTSALLIGFVKATNIVRNFLNGTNSYVDANYDAHSVYTSIMDASNSIIARNGVIGSTTNNASGTSVISLLRIGANTANTAGTRVDGTIQEAIIYPTDQSTNRIGIEANINKGFNIYWDGTQKGLLDTYTGAEAAYSLRALNSAYTGAIIKVRRASDNAEQDIYAKWDGTLNVEALETFCAATDGYVVTWYDQSGNANNATQATAASQPQIVSSGSVILENGKPALDFDGVDDFLQPLLKVSLQEIAMQFVYNYKTLSNSGMALLLSEVPQSYNAFNSPIETRNSFLGGGVAQQRPISKSTDQRFWSLYANSSLAAFYLNGAKVGADMSPNTDSPSSHNLTIGAYFNNTIHANIKAQELVLYQSDQSTNRNGIESRINNYYNIY